MKNKILLPTLLLALSGGLLFSCADTTENVSIDEKKAYASSSALSLVNQTSSTKQRKMLSSSMTNPFSDLISQFDTLIDAQESVNVEVKTNEEGEYQYTSEITIGENSNFTYALNYNQVSENNVTTETGELVINYAPLEFNFSLNFENVITYNEDEKNGSVNFKLYIDLLNKENKTTYVEVNESLDLNNPDVNAFDYSLVINEQEIMSYKIEIPQADGQALNIYMGDAKYSVRREVTDGVSKIIMSSYLGDVELFTLTYTKNTDEEGNVIYSLETGGSILG